MIRKLYKSFGTIQKKLFWLAFIGLFIFGVTQIDLSQVRGLLTALGLRIETVGTIQNLEDYNGYGSTVYVTDTSRGGTFKYVSTGLTPDSGTVFKANGKGGGYWRRQWDFLKVNATWFGASNNGVTDATNGIQLAINFLDINKGGTGGTVYFPAGTYIVSSPIFFGNKVNLEGTWWSTIQAANGSNCDMFQNPASGNIGYFKIVSLRFNGNNGNNPTGSFYHVRYNGSQSSDEYFENCLIVHFSNDAFNIENGWQYHINNCVIEFIGGSCVRLNPSISNAAQNDIRRVWISNSGLYKMVGDSTSALIEMSGNMTNRYILGVYITNCKIENSGAFQPAIRMKGAQDVQITGSFITAYPDNSLNNQVNVITVDSSALGSITGNNINSWLEYGMFSGTSAWNKAKYGIYFTDSSFNWTVSGNNYWHTGTDSIHIDSSCYNIYSPQKLIAGTNISIVGNTISATGGSSYTLPTASSTVLGGVKVGSGLGIDGSGVLSTTGATTYLPLAGGTMTGAILPNATASLNFGSNSFAWNTGYMYQVLSPNILDLQGSSGQINLHLGGNIIGIMKNYNTTAITDNGINAFQWSGSVKMTGLTTAYAAKSANYTLGVNDYTIEVTATGTTQTLPTAVGIAGRKYTILYTGATGTATIATTSSQTFLNITGTPTTLTLSAPGTGAITSYDLQANGGNWLVTAKVKND